jgi:hypothetical protein
MSQAAQDIPGRDERTEKSESELVHDGRLTRAGSGLTPPLRVVIRPILPCGNVVLFCFKASQDDEPLSC